MAYISFQPSDFFNTVLYTGNGTAIGSGGQSITGVGFQPDWVWTKARSQPHSHTLYDSSRGVQKPLVTNSTASESTETEGLDSFDSDGFTTGNKDNSGQSGTTYASWHWKANGGTTSSNTDGSITSTVQANTTAGFSVVTWTGNATASATVGHGLGVAPEVVIIKNRSDNESWWVGHQGAGSIGDGKYLLLNSTNAVGTNNTSFCNANPTTTTIKVGGSTSADNAINGSGDNMLAYCFAEIKGYSKFGSYTGNGSTNGTYVYTGFRPAFVMTKRTNAIGPWNMKDTKRPGYNDTDDSLFADSSAAEDTRGFDILSNGFKLRNSGTEMNGGGSTYIYMAFAEFPVVGSNGLPATAR